MFNSITKKVDNINIALEYSLLEAINKKFGKKKSLFDCFDRS